MLKRLKVKNYQSHEESLLEFCPGINAVVGITQAGKTAILRALLWLMNNRPRGFRFHSHFAESSSVVELVTDDHVVKREKASKNNSGFYYLDGRELSGFGQGVPDEVIDALNMSEVNIQQQLEQPFLITASPTEVARVINKAIRLENSAQWMKELNSRINMTSRDVKRLKSEIDETKEELKQYSNIDEIESEIEELTNVERDIGLSENQIQELEVFIIEIGERIDTIDTLDERVGEIEQPLAEAIHLSEVIGEITVAVDQLRNVRDLSISIRDQNRILLAEKFVRLTFGLVDEIEEIGSVIDDLHFYVVSLDSVIKSRETTDQTLKKARKDLFSAWKSIKRCPLCFSRMEIGLIEEKMELI